MAVVMQLAFQSIGVVYGDIGTSPLYVFASTFADRVPSNDDIVGALSLIIYSLTLFPLVKYVFIVLWANDNGDGKLLQIAKPCDFVGLLLKLMKYIREVDLFVFGHRWNLRNVFIDM